MLKSRILSLSAFLIFLTFAGAAMADEADPYGFLSKKFIGARLGVWVNSGDSLAPGNNNVSNTTFYGEFFFSRHIWPAIAGEFIVGLYGRGNVELTNGGNTYRGQLSIYPILVTAKFYPLAGLPMIQLKPYLQAGGGLIVGNRPTFTYVDAYYGYDVQQQTKADITYVLGAGFDFPVADQIALTANFRYTPANFGGDFDGAKDFSGYQFTIGAGYIFK